MASNKQKFDGYKVDEKPEPDQPVEVLCMDSYGAHNLPFLCRWQDGAWMNAETGKVLLVDVLGWRIPKKTARRWR